MRGIYTYKITLSNTTSTATSTGFQVRLNINFAAIKDLSVDLGNIRFSSDSAGNNLLYAWLESAPQGTFTQGSSVSSYTSSNVWVNLGNNIIPANGSLTIYMQILPSGTEFDGVYWGANPQWTNTYGQYDNGANVFSFYDNFAGTSLSSKWNSGSSGGTITVNNGLTETVPYNAPTGSYVYISTNSYQITGNQIVESYANLNSFDTTNFRIVPVAVTASNSEAWHADNSINEAGGGWVGNAFQPNGIDAITTTTSASNGFVGSNYIVSNSNYNIFGVWYTPSELYVAYNNETTPYASTTTYVPATPLYVTISIWLNPAQSIYSTTYPMNVYWVRIRVYPPNGTDPVLISITLLFVGNYISASIPSPEWTILSGKPYITVSAKGISNGLSNIPNDGADFGPDTFIGASLPNQYGPPYTQTCGIQEACNYAYNNGYAVHLTTGIFEVNATIQIPGPLQISGSGGVPGMNEEINGVYDPYTSAVSGPVTVIKLTTAANWVFQNTNYMSGMSITHLIIDCNLLGNGIQFTCPSAVPNNAHFDFTRLSIINYSTIGADFTQYGDLYLIGLKIDTTSNNYTGLILGGGNCSIHLYSVVVQRGNTILQNGTELFIQIGGMLRFITAVGNCEVISIFGARFESIIPTPGYSIEQINIIGANPAVSIIDLKNLTSTSLVIGQINIKDSIYDGTATTFFSNVATGVTALSTIANLNIEGLVAYSTFTDLPEAVFNPVTLEGTQRYWLQKYTYPGYPTSITNAPTSGTVTQAQIAYTPTYKKIIFYFVSYENDTATNQSITFLNAFSTIASITSNTTSLTITATTTGITITAPNNTTLYSGILIVEGY